MHYRSNYSPCRGDCPAGANPANLRPLVVLAGDQAPTRRKKVIADGAAAEVNKPADVDPLELERKASTRLTWAQALRAAFTTPTNCTAPR